MGLLVPSSIILIKALCHLRRLFLDHCNWSLLFCFINHRRIFDIDSTFKFVALQIEKGGKTEHVEPRLIKKCSPI